MSIIASLGRIEISARVLSEVARYLARCNAVATFRLAMPTRYILMYWITSGTAIATMIMITSVTIAISIRVKPRLIDEQAGVRSRGLPDIAGGVWRKELAPMKHSPPACHIH